MKQSPLEQKVSEIAAPVINDMGFELVCVTIKGAKGSRIVEIMAEDPQTKRLGVDDCARISRDVAAAMDVEDPIDGKYRLEVSSPGIDRPLIRLQDFVDNIGFEAKITLNMPIETGQKKFRGRIENAGQNKETGENTVTINTDQGVFELEFGRIEKAKLVLTDDLIKATKTA